MKIAKQIIASLVILLISFTTIHAQEEATGMPGDHFSLYGALELFKKSESLEQFEELLNKENSEVNNLDLNGDGEVDYIRVIDNMDKDAHAITLQVLVSEKESQDIAIIAIEKTGSESATLQIIGDEDVFGEELIIEPIDDSAVSDDKRGPSANYEVSKIMVNVWLWPSVRWIYRPAYVPYVSPWYWGYYPRWRRPWKPLSWTVFSPRIVRYQVGYRVSPTIRVTTARNIYAPRRTTSVTVVNKYTVNKNSYVTKKKSTTVVKSGDKKAVVQKSETKAIAKDGNKSMAGSKKETKVKVKKGDTEVKGSKATTTKKVKTGENKVVKKTSTKKVKKKKG